MNKLDLFLIMVVIAPVNYCEFMFSSAEPVNVSFSCVCKKAVTHLGLETLENRCHHLPDFLCTDQKK